MHKLKGKIQHYAWGGYHFIPQLLGIKNDNHQPFAEYWLGTHINGPTLVKYNDNQHIPLPEFIKKNPETVLGKTVAARFNNLPYLLKVLDVKNMLSIQVHPSKTEAEKGFAKENALGIPIDAMHRNYKDDNHKPEVMVALSEFWLLHGFKEKKVLTATLQNTEALQNLLPVFEKEGYYSLYKYVMEMPQSQVNEVLKPLLQQAEPLYKNNQLRKTDPAYWACKLLTADNSQLNKIDRGIFSIYLFNLVYLYPGQAIFQGAGVPHAYLEGQNIELMSNSDNVLRGGLTTKHIDIPELLKHTLFQGFVPHILNGEKKGTETIYHCPVPDFVISKIQLDLLSTYQHLAISAEILLLTEGEACISSDKQTLSIKKGEAVLINAAENYSISSKSSSVLFKAAVPEKIS